MADKNTEFEMANYDGRIPAHPQPEESGRLILTTVGEWQIHYGGKGMVKKKQWISEQWSRYPMTAVATGPNSCHITITDAHDPSFSSELDLPKTSASEFADAYESHRGNFTATAIQAKELQERVESGAWWLRTDAFKGLGFTGTLRVPETHYLGGWQGQDKTYTGKISDGNSVMINKGGVNYIRFKTVFTIPWNDIISVDVEGPDLAQRHLTAVRILALGVFALAAPKKSKIAMLMVSTRNGDVAVFQTEKMTALELKGKLAPISSQISRAQNQFVGDQAPEMTPTPPLTPPAPRVSTPPPPPPGSPAGWLVDPLGKHENRYWDGGKWTEHVATNGEQSVDFL
jgi:hypothetical protein